MSEGFGVCGLGAFPLCPLIWRASGSPVQWNGGQFGLDGLVFVWVEITDKKHEFVVIGIWWGLGVLHNKRSSRCRGLEADVRMVEQGACKVGRRIELVVEEMTGRYRPLRDLWRSIGEGEEILAQTVPVLRQIVNSFRLTGIKLG